MIKRDGSLFEDVSLSSVRVLTERLKDVTSMERNLLRRRYEEEAVAFGATLAFTDALDIVRVGGGTVARGSRYAQVQAVSPRSKQEFGRTVVDLALKSGTAYEGELRAVFSAFSPSQGSPRLRAMDLAGEQYAARNLLIEAGAIHARKPASYILDDMYMGDYLSSRFLDGTPPAKLDEIHRKQEEIGLMAELEVLKHERELVGPEDHDAVIHVASFNSAAGFDIASVRRDASTKDIRVRLIEVKAVSPKDWRFTLTRNEKAVAIESQGTYFLYLVPVVHGEPDVRARIEISDPIRILARDAGWTSCATEWEMWKVYERA